MKKWKKIVIVLLCIAVLLGIGGYFAYNMAFDFVQDKMIETMLDSMLDSGDVSVEELELMAEVTLPEEPEAPAESIISDATQPTTPVTSESAATLKQEPAKTETKNSQKQPEKPQTKPEPKQEPVQSAKPENKPAEEKRTEAVDKMTQKISDSITRADKRAMARLVTSHLSASDIKYLAGLIAGGLTRDERLAAYRLAKQRFSGEELELVSMYYHRYKKQIMIEPDYPTK